MVSFPPGSPLEKNIIDMPSLSFTAPRFTDEEDKEERETLTKAELAEIFADIYGDAPFSIQETDDTQCKAIAEFDEALSKISESDKRDYLQAIEHAPAIVQKESSKFLFLRCEGYDAEVSAYGSAQIGSKYGRDDY